MSAPFRIHHDVVLDADSEVYDAAAPYRALVVNQAGGAVAHDLHPYSPALHVTLFLAPHLAPVPCTVLDLFNGRTTTGVATLRNGRHYVGVEINPKDATLSEKRLQRVKPPRVVPLAGGGAVALRGDVVPDREPASTPDLFATIEGAA